MKIKDLILDRLEVSVSRFCREAGIHRNTAENILKDKHTPSLLTIKKICKYFGVDYKDYI